MLYSTSLDERGDCNQTAKRSILIHFALGESDCKNSLTSRCRHRALKGHAAFFFEWSWKSDFVCPSEIFWTKILWHVAFFECQALIKCNSIVSRRPFSALTVELPQEAFGCDQRHPAPGKPKPSKHSEKGQSSASLPPPHQGKPHFRFYPQLICWKDKKTDKLIASHIKTAAYTSGCTT